MDQNIQIIQDAFTQQSASFDTYQNDHFKNAFSQSLIAHMAFTGEENVLEIAAGTCALGRMIAPHVRQITELDVTEAMLLKGKEANDRAGITNACYYVGNAEQLPFLHESFDCVVTRLSFHHFQNPEVIMREMIRVVRTGGQIGIIDMVPSDPQARETFDTLEKLRDASHVRCFTSDELQNMMERYGLQIAQTDQETIPMDLSAWMQLTHTDAASQKTIQDALEEELHGGKVTGMDPFIQEGHMHFYRHWISLLGVKKPSSDIPAT